MAGQTNVTMSFRSLETDIVGDDQVKSDAAIQSTKLEHFQKAYTNFATAIGGTPATREENEFTASKASSLKAFHCLLNVTGTTSDIDFDVKKNGTTVLSAVTNITNATTDAAVQTGALTASPTTLAIDDVISISMAVTTATGATGAYAWVEIEEVGV